MGRYGLDSSSSRWGLVVGCCEHCNEPSGSVIFWEVREYLSGCWLLKKDMAPWN
jgi:hypothetical protein